MKALNPLPEIRACETMLQLCTILKELRNKKIVHRDIKPSNLFFCPKGVLLLNDFETAFEETEHMPENTCGTPAYMPPEQFTSSQVDYNADQYAAGMVFFQLLCGTLPYSESDKEKLYLLKEKQFSPADTNPKLSKASCDICSTMTSPDKTTRFDNINDIITQLLNTKNSLQQKTQILQAPTLKIPSSRRQGKKKLPFLLLGIAVLVIYIIYYSNN